MMTDQEYQKYFPLDDRNADPLKWKKDKVVYRYSFDLAKDSVVRPDKNGWSNGYYLLEIHGRDNFGKAFKLEHLFVLYSAREKSTPVMQPFWSRVIRDNAEAR
jgi:hypothetical protein